MYQLTFAKQGKSFTHTFSSSLALTYAKRTVKNNGYTIVSQKKV